MASIRLPLLIAAMLIVSAGLRAVERTFDDYAGGWELFIGGTDSTFHSGCLFIAPKGETAEGELVWRWGSVWKFSGPEAVRIDKDGDLLIRRGDWKKPLELRLLGKVLEGSLERPNGAKFTVTGTRAESGVAATGTWDVALELDGGPGYGRMVVEGPETGALRVRGFDEDGREIPCEKPGLEGNRLRGVFVPPDGNGFSLRMDCHLRGDRLEGKVTTAGEERSFGLRGTRRRRWGEPVRLLAEEGLEGWRPRDDRGHFGWKCSGGVLTNAPPDVDIVSERQFDDFRLELEYKVERRVDAKGKVHRSNSGVYLRGRYEVQILDDHDRPVEAHGNGAIYSRAAPALNASAPPGVWQKYEITLIGRYVTVVLNGKTIIDNQRLGGERDDGLLPPGITGGAELPYESLPGPLMLQGDHGKIWYRNITVTPALPAVP